MRIFIIGLLLCYSGIAFSVDNCSDNLFSEFNGIGGQSCRAVGSYNPFDPDNLKNQMPWETNYWECILDEMPGAKTKTVAFAVRRKCNQYGKNYKIEKKSSFFGIKNASECVIEYASDTPSETAAKAIRQACNRLYVR